MSANIMHPDFAFPACAARDFTSTRYWLTGIIAAIGERGIGNDFQSSRLPGPSCR